MSDVIDLEEKRKASRSRTKTKTDSVGIEAAVARINRTRALVLVGDKALILREEVGESGRVEVTFQTPPAFKLWFANERYHVDGEMVGIGELWLISPSRRQYQGITFLPPRASFDGKDYVMDDVTPEGWYNLWRGFTVQPAAPYAGVRTHREHFPKLFGHVLDNVCRGDRDLCRWVFGWFAHMFQRPDERLGTSLVMRGRQGAGKTTVGEAFGALLGPHYVLVDNPRYIVGQFNSHMASCLLLQADEGFWAGDKNAEGTLKGLVTSKVHMIERKGVDPVPVRNLVRLLVSSNNAWVVPAGMEERRFAVLDVGDGCLQNGQYFREMWEELENGGLAHLLAYALRFDLGAVDLRSIPATDALWEQKVASLAPVQSWWLERLRAGAIAPLHRSWKGWVSSDAVQASYTGFCDRLGITRKNSREQMGAELRRLMPKGFDRAKDWVALLDENGVEKRDVSGNALRERVWGYRFPALDLCRTHFSELVRHPVPWDEGEDSP